MAENQPPESIVFRTPTKLRFWESLAAGVIGTGSGFIIVALAVVAAIALVERGGLNIALAASLMLPIALAGAILGWRLYDYRIHDRILLDAENITIGVGPLALVVRYEAVEEIQFVPCAQEVGLVLRAKHRFMRIVLSSPDAERASTWLGTLCINAVFADSSGREHVSRGRDNPLLVVSTLQRRQWRKVAALLCGALPFAVLVAGRVWVIAAWLAGDIDLAVEDHVFVWMSLGFCLLVIIVLVKMAWDGWRSAREAGQLRRALQNANRENDPSLHHTT